MNGVLLFYYFLKGHFKVKPVFLMQCALYCNNLCMNIIDEQFAAHLVHHNVVADLFKSKFTFHSRQLSQK